MVNYSFLIVVVVVLLVTTSFMTYHGLQLNNDQYDRLKKIVINWSAIVAFLSVIVSTFKEIPYGTETVAVVAAFGVFLAKCLGESDKSFNSGAEVIEGDEPLEDGDLDE